MGTTFSSYDDQNETELKRYLAPPPDFYQLVDETGGGELVRLMKIAMKTNDFDEIDKTIRVEVVKYLYNEGRGDYVTKNRK